MNKQLESVFVVLAPSNLLLFSVISTFSPSAMATEHDFASSCASSQFSSIEKVHYRPPKVINKIAVSLQNIQAAISKGEIPKSLELPISRIKGIVFTNEGDIIVKGLEERGQTAIKIRIDDLIVSFRTIIRQEQPPGVSIDPVFKNGEMEDYQNVDYFGSINGTRFGQVAFETDYWMKKVASGKVSVNVQGFCSYLDRIKNEISESSDRLSGFGTRFWFYPKDSKILVSRNHAAMNLIGGGVELLSESQHLSRQRGVLISANSTTDSASGFARQMTDQLEELGVVFPDLIRLRNYFSLSEIFTWAKPKIGALDDWQYLLYEYEPDPVFGRSKAKTVTGASYRVGAKQYALQGGVNITIRLPKKPEIENSRELTKEVELILAARPARGDIFWSY